MNKEDLKIVRQIVKETTTEVLDIQFWGAFFELINSFEAGISAFKQRVSTEKGVLQKTSWSPNKIKWVQAESASGKGPFERADSARALAGEA